MNDGQNPCEVVITHFDYGSQICGVLGIHKWDGHSVCDDHFKMLLKEGKKNGD